MAKIKRKIAKKEVSKTDAGRDILKMAEQLKQECSKRKCDCPLFDRDNGECTLTKGDFNTPMNWEI